MNVVLHRTAMTTCNCRQEHLNIENLTVQHGGWGVLFLTGDTEGLAVCKLAE